MPQVQPRELVDDLSEQQRPKRQSEPIFANPPPTATRRRRATEGGQVVDLEKKKKGPQSGVTSHVKLRPVTVEGGNGKFRCIAIDAYHPPYLGTAESLRRDDTWVDLFKTSRKNSKLEKVRRRYLEKRFGSSSTTIQRWHQPSSSSFRKQELELYERTQVSRWETLMGKLLLQCWFYNKLGAVVLHKHRERREFSVAMLLGLTLQETEQRIDKSGKPRRHAAWNTRCGVKWDDAPKAQIYRKVPIVEGEETCWGDCDVVESGGRRFAYVPLDAEGYYALVAAGLPRPIRKNRPKGVTFSAETIKIYHEEFEQERGSFRSRVDL